ncbi:YhjD/YihY/BrkB family envelope integrity protein [uncultured Amnibacterium sp.]|uniref:YihY/virulence factor BrkB family protein n=1 Tax=uncultured Amnibacterium sp. TaxID=1631851 RepID=UPI0035CB1EA9
MALLGRDQGVRDDEVSAEASGAKPDAEAPRTGIAGLVQTVFALRPVRVLLHYSADNGPLIASGMTYQAIFALFAGLWFVFSVAGFVIEGDPALQDTLFSTLNRFIPGLISYPGNGDSGAIKAATLLNTSALSWSGAISLVGVLLTAVGFLGTLRTAIRIMFDLPNPTTNPVVLKLKDLGLTIAFGAVVLLSAVLSLVSNTALDAVLSLLGFGGASVLQQLATSAVTSVLLVGIDTALLMGAFRILSGVAIPFRRLLVGSLIGGVALTVLQTLGTSLLGGASSNPVIGAFATLVGVLLYFNFVCQVILVAASWVDVGMEDAGIDPRTLSPEQRERQHAEQLEDARRLVAQANQEALQQRVAASSGLRRWRLERELQRETRAEERRRADVPTETEFARAQEETGDPDPDARQVERTTGR